MKYLIPLLMSLTMGLALQPALDAQTTTKRSERKALRQRARIHEGRKSGELTRREARQLRKQQRRIDMRKRHAASDGVVTPDEQRSIDRSQRRANRNIFRKKHNTRTR